MDIQPVFPATLAEALTVAGIRYTAETDRVVVTDQHTDTVIFVSRGKIAPTVVYSARIVGEILAEDVPMVLGMSMELCRHLIGLRIVPVEVGGGNITLDLVVTESAAGGLTVKQLAEFFLRVHEIIRNCAEGFTSSLPGYGAGAMTLSERKDWTKKAHTRPLNFPRGTRPITDESAEDEETMSLMTADLDLLEELGFHLPQETGSFDQEQLREVTDKVFGEGDGVELGGGLSTHGFPATRRPDAFCQKDDCWYLVEHMNTYKAVLKDARLVGKAVIAVNTRADLVSATISEEDPHSLTFTVPVFARTGLTRAQRFMAIAHGAADVRQSIEIAAKMLAEEL